MKPKTTKTVAKLTVAALAIFAIYKYFSTKIVVTNINDVAGTLDYKVCIGFKTYKGTLTKNQNTVITQQYRGYRVSINLVKNNIVQIYVYNPKSIIVESFEYFFTSKTLVK